MNASASEVTVVLCTRDGRSKGYLDEALRSVLAQSPAPAEIILVDDRSTDGTAAYVLDAYRGVTVMANAGIGLAAARNTGIAAARGRWIGFIDDDDLWLPEKLAEQLAQINAADRAESTVWASAMGILEEGGVIPVLAPPMHLATWPACLLGSPIAPSGVLVSRDLLRHIGPFNQDLHEGSAYEYWIRCFASGVPVRFSRLILVHHRRHQRQMTDSARRLDHLVGIDAIIQPYTKTLPTTLAQRLRMARALTQYRSVLAHAGFRAASQYWTRTSLRPRRTGWRACAYFMLDTAASLAPATWVQALREQAVRALMGSN